MTSRSETTTTWTTIRVRRAIRHIAGTTMVLVLAACSSQQPPTPPPPATIAPPPANPADPATAAQHTYEQFWVTTEGIGALPPEQWRPQLEQVAGEPVLTQLLNGTRAHHDQGIALYGMVIAHVTGVQLAGNQAVVTDCQDASRAGQADAKTGAHNTVGIPRNPVKGTLQLGPDGQWRVMRIDYPGGTC